MNRNTSLPPPNEPREGDVYAVVEVFGKIFELRYGYYDDRDRTGPPDVIYPDLLKDPVYTEDGCPLVTMMQDACPHYKGSAGRPDDAICGECRCFVRGEEWFGLCRSPKNRREETPKQTCNPNTDTTHL